MNFEAQRIRFAQVGLVNLARHMVGVQIGLFNYARRLRGLQLGLANLTSKGGLPFCPVANVGF